MEAATAPRIPAGGGWQYEPKWDGFRCLVFREGAEVEIRSKAGKPLARYFPELVEAVREMGAQRFVLDGEVVIPVEGELTFEQLLQRIHPAESRVRSLSEAHPAHLVAFDLLLGYRGGPLVDRPLVERRPRLEAFAERFFGERFHISPATSDADTARSWLERADIGLDGVMAKELDSSYRSGERAGMVKIKKLRTAECVVGGFRYAAKSKIVGSLLLGLYDAEGLLHHVGFTSALTREVRKEITPELERLVKPPGFTGHAPGGKSRWSTDRSGDWQPLRPDRVAEVRYDHFSGGRFRHGTKFLRWRPDKPPEMCRMEQVEREGRTSARLL